MLQAVQRPDKQLVNFTYDALGRRLTKTYKDKTTHFIWDRNTPLHEWVSDASDSQLNVDKEGRFKVELPNEKSGLITWIFDEGTFKPAAKILGDQTFSIITDYLGTPVEMYDADGQEIWAAEYDIFGKIRKLDIGSLSDCPFRYQGQYDDVETGLYYNRFRYYDHKIGGYISQDPIGLEGGMPNMYAYVHNLNSLIDPFGLSGYVTATLALSDGTQFIAKSKRAILSGELADIVDAVKKDLNLRGLLREFHGNCGEIRAIRKALDAGFSLDDLKGAKMLAVITDTGEIKKACDCCSAVLDKLGIEEVTCLSCP